MSETRLAVRLIVRRADGAVLLLQRAAADEWGAGLWEFPGGGPEPGESTREAAAREGGEESGLLLRPEQLLFLGLWERPVQAGQPRSLERMTRSVYFLAQGEEEPLIHLSHEHDAQVWLQPGSELAGGRFAGGRLTPSAHIGLALLEEHLDALLPASILAAGAPAESPPITEARG